MLRFFLCLDFTTSINFHTEENLNLTSIFLNADISSENKI